MRTPSRKPESILVAGERFELLSPSRSSRSSSALRPYVGRSTETGKLTVFRSDVTPTEATHGDRFKYAIGPFKTSRAAYLMAERSEGNPHLVTVEECERFARLEVRS